MLKAGLVFQKLSKSSHRFLLRRLCSSSGSDQNFLNGTNANYIEHMHSEWQTNPGSVHPAWNAYFQAVEKGVDPEYISPFSLMGGKAQGSVGTAGSPSSSVDPGVTGKLIADHLSVQAIIKSYQLLGHHIANLDPLGMNDADLSSEIPTELKLESYGFTEQDLDRTFRVSRVASHIGGDQEYLTLREILRRLEAAYCGSIGVEYMFLENKDQIDWIRRKFETPGLRENFLNRDEKRKLLARITRSWMFEDFLRRKYETEKRFGLEGCEVLIPCMKTIIDISSSLGTSSYVIGMAHRGRLNVLANVCRQPLNKIFVHFDPNSQISQDHEQEGSGGDVKYHLGVSNERINRYTNNKIKVSLCANPSHLEAVAPVVQGKTRAEQFYRDDRSGKSVLSMHVHGDAAFAGQGVVYETFDFSGLPGYTTHGSVHIVVNNQIGFTTDPRKSRSSPYCTAVANVVSAPIFHVNADDPEAVQFVAQVAAEWRATFGRDCVIDLVCYRKYGHNEQDEPMMTQPVMYKHIAKHPSVLEIYSKQLTSTGFATPEEVEIEKQKYATILEQSLSEAKKQPSISFKDWLDSPWHNFFESRRPRQMDCPATGIEESTMQAIAEKFTQGPPDKDFEVNRKLKNRILGTRQQLASDRRMNWAMGEAFAFGSLLMEKVHVRLSGQDVERGTFAHRHHVLHDQATNKTYSVLGNLSPDQAQYHVVNSSLSEFAVLGFELGYSMHSPDALVIWEAQFGDFSNNAQCIIDQFISSGQKKWVRQTGLVMLLPHGMEGQGPEHSSARLERFLQMCDDDPDIMPKFNDQFEMQQIHELNWIVCNPTMPAQLAHLLRRQIALPLRKPLIVMTPKSGLSHDLAISSWDELGPGTKFQRVLGENGPAGQNPDHVKKVIFCTGRVWYKLFQTRQQLELDDKIALIRVEQICPFPYDLIYKELQKYPNAEKTWCQEEHKNQGAWSYVQPRFSTLMRHQQEETGRQLQTLEYAGRFASASPASGTKQMHAVEEATFVTEAMNLPL